MTTSVLDALQPISQAARHFASRLPATATLLNIPRRYGAAKVRTAVTISAGER